MNAIETTGLTKTYRGARGIDRLNLTVPVGDFFGFIGPNGAGKSTTVRILLGLISPTAGTASVLGIPCTPSATPLLADVGYVPSEVSFYDRMRVSDVIALSARLRRRDCRAEADALCRRLSVDTDKRVSELSLGNKKKVAIVCALQHKPPLYILDEPTSGLDPLIQDEFFAILKERHRAGATVFFSSHILSEVQAHCTRAAMIREGRLIACDTMENLAQRGARRVTVRGIGAVPAIPGIRQIAANGDSVTFLYSGVMADLLAALAVLPVTDLLIAEPDLHEVFLHYYGKEDATV